MQNCFQYMAGYPTAGKHGLCTLTNELPPVADKMTSCHGRPGLVGAISQDTPDRQLVGKTRPTKIRENQRTKKKTLIILLANMSYVYRYMISI